MLGMDREGFRRFGALNGALAEIRHVEMLDGFSRGVRVLQVRTGGGLRFDVLPDRGLDIGACELGDRSIGWRSATGVRHPAYFEASGDGGFSWLRSFSGLLVTGGLDHVFAPAEREASHFAYPNRSAIAHPLHGRIANTPAYDVRWGEQWDAEEPYLWIEGSIRQAAVFGEDLLLRRRWEAPIGGTTIRLLDKVSNEGYDPTPHELLYHVNLGWPLLDEGARFSGSIARTVWSSTPSPTDPWVIGPPEGGFVEAAFVHEPTADSRGAARARLDNVASGLAFELEFSPDQFPHLVQWLYLREGNYALAIEPATVSPDRATKDPIWLLRGDERHYRTTWRFESAAAPSVTNPKQ